MEFVAPLARIDPIYKEEEEAFKVRFAHKLVVSRTPLPPFAHKLFLSRTPLPPLRTNFSYPEPPFPLCAQAFRIQYPPPPFAHKLFVSSTPLPPFAHKLFVSSTPTSPLRISFSYPVPPSPLCAQAFVSRREYPLVDRLLVKLTSPKF